MHKVKGLLLPYLYCETRLRTNLSISWQAPIRWFEPEAYKAKLAAAGPVAILPIGEAETDPEWGWRSICRAFLPLSSPTLVTINFQRYDVCVL